MASPQTRTLAAGGLPVTIYSDPIDSEAALPLAVVFVLHGRMSHSGANPIVSTILECFAEVTRRRETGANITKQLVVVAVDHRNHGHRTVDKAKNLGWDADPLKDNATHAVDMYAQQVGTARDVSFLIDFLPAYLFPSGENNVADWGVIGVSMGGHSVWILLREEPRITFGVPIIGCPNYTPLMERRMEQTFGTTELKGPRYPDSLRAHVEKSLASVNHSVPDALNPFFGKKILVLSGADDQLVPWVASKNFVDALAVGPQGVKRVIVENGAGHEVTELMKRETAAFVADGLTSGVPSRM